MVRDHEHPAGFLFPGEGPLGAGLHAFPRGFRHLGADHHREIEPSGQAHEGAGGFGLVLLGGIGGGFAVAAQLPDVVDVDGSIK